MMSFVSRRTFGKKRRGLWGAFLSDGDGACGVIETLEARVLLSGTLFEVNTLTDFLDADDDLLTLREAIVAANTNIANGNIEAGSATEVDVIRFDQAALEVEAGVGEPFVIRLNGTQLEISESLNIKGLHQAPLTINANQLSRVFHISGEQNNTHLSNLTIAGGYTDVDGGAIQSLNANLDLNHVTIKNNIARLGGAIYNDHAQITLFNSTISGNQALTGGGIYNYTGQLDTYNSAIIDNFATHNSGAIYGGDISLTHSTVAGNYSNPDSDFRSYGGIFAYSFTSINNSIVSQNHSANGTKKNTNNNILQLRNSILEMDPGFIRVSEPGVDEIWGTEDDIPGDYRLRDTSLAINSGDNNLALNDQSNPITHDLDGAPRIADGRVDIGAYEFQGTLSTFAETPATHVTTISDTEDSTDHQVTLREAIFYNQTLQQDITFAPHLADGVITLNQRELIIGHSTRIDATPVGGVTIDADGHSRVLSILGESTQASLTGLTITGGNAPRNGGGLYINAPNGSVTLDRVMIRHNSAHEYSRGGGIYNGDTPLQITNSTISYNNGGVWGGGIYSIYGRMNIQNSTISHNTAHSAGGIYSLFGELTINRSTIANNQAVKEQQRLYGGFAGIYVAASPVVITNSQIINNSAELFVGGIYGSRINLKMINTLVAGNTARTESGGLSLQSSNAEIINSTIAGNAADMYGGITNEYSGNHLTLTNTIVAHNHANEEPNLYNSGTITNNSSLVGIDPQFVRNPSPGDDLIWGTADDDYGDLRLRLTSPGVNTGDNALLPLDVGDVDGDGDVGEVLPWDLDGGERVYGGVVDMGAYENREALPLLVGDFNGDESIDLSDADLISAAIHTGNQNPLFDLDGDEQVDLLDGRLLVTDHLYANPADSNLDGAVNIEDLINWARHFGSDEPVFSEGDTNFDGKVNIGDLIDWAQNFGQAAPVAPAITESLMQSSNAVTSVMDGEVFGSSLSVISGLDSNPWGRIRKLVRVADGMSGGVDIIRNVRSVI